MHFTIHQSIGLYVLNNGWSVATEKFLDEVIKYNKNLPTRIQDYFYTDLGPL